MGDCSKHIESEQELKDLKDKVDRILTEEHNDHHEFIKVLVEREKDRKALRRAIIEKTITSLIWGAVVLIATSLWSMLKSQR